MQYDDIQKKIIVLSLAVNLKWSKLVKGKTGTQLAEEFDIGNMNNFWHIKTSIYTRLEIVEYNNKNTSKTILSLLRTIFTLLSINPDILLFGPGTVG